MTPLLPLLYITGVQAPESALRINGKCQSSYAHKHLYTVSAARRVSLRYYGLSTIIPASVALTSHLARRQGAPNADCGGMAALMQHERTDTCCNIPGWKSRIFSRLSAPAVLGLLRGLLHEISFKNILPNEAPFNQAD
ncbi:hypothetical protein C8R43DRAFT_953229 [Mycena crocata]|nr:hypothetical protein C8R43DRAFT_953229 [Mycena crocata]